MAKVFSKNEYSFLELFSKFVKESANGKRVQANGKRIGSGTVATYDCTLRLLERFAKEKQFYIRVRDVFRLSKREKVVEKNYWKKFYRQYTHFLYDELGYYDNYVGHTVKIVRLFFNYLKKDKSIDAGDFYKQFYVFREEIAIFPLMPEELNYLVYDKAFEASLTKRLREVKDFFVFGCTVALRFSDLNALQKNNIRYVNGTHYLVVRSIKTSTDTLIKLPDYAVAITEKYKRQKKKLLPPFNISNINEYVKILTEKAGFTQPVHVTRNRRGVPVEQKSETGKTIRFCDVVSSHTMRRTAITTMLSLGVPEQVVRKVSGHASGSKEFYRYVFWSQTYQDNATEAMFKKLQNKQLRVIG